MKYLLSLLFATGFLAVHGIGFFNANEELTVFTISGINLRDQPNGAVIAHIPYAAKVLTQEAKSPLVTASFEGIPGNWTKVKFDGRIGYVFDGYLSHLPAPGLEEANLEVYARKHFTFQNDSILISLFENSDGNSEDYIQVFQSNWGPVGFESSVYYEGGSESLSIPKLSLEEGYLLVRILFREAYKWAKENNEIYTENFDKRAYDMLILNGASSVYTADGNVNEVMDYYFVDLSGGCYSGINVMVKKNRLMIVSSGGC